MQNWIVFATGKMRKVFKKMMYVFFISFAFVLVGCTNDTKIIPNESSSSQTEEHIHEFNKEVASDKYLKQKATCTSKAVYYKSCECGEKGTETFEYGDLAPHNYEWVIDKEATEKEQGIKHKECTICHHKVEENSIIEKLTCSHTYKLVYGEEATCEKDGIIPHYHCDKCDKDFDLNKVEITDLVQKAKGHTYGELHQEVSATCTADGTIAYYQCSECNKYFDINKKEVSSLVIPAVGHNYGELITRVDSDCNNDGTIAHYHCDKCGKDFDENKVEVSSLVIPKSHNIGAWNEAVPATTLQAGMKGNYHCSLCDKYFDIDMNEVNKNSVIIPKLENFSGWNTTIENGETIYNPIGDGGYLTYNEIPSKNLSFDIKMITGSEMTSNIAFIYQFANANYRFIIRPIEQKIIIGKCEATSDKEIESVYSNGFLANEKYYHIQLQITDTSLQIYINGGIYLEYTHGETNPTPESLKVWSWGCGAFASIMNFNMNPEVLNDTIESECKLDTYWYAAKEKDESGDLVVVYNSLYKTYDNIGTIHVGNTSDDTFEMKFRVNDAAVDRNIAMHIIVNEVDYGFDYRPDLGVTRVRINGGYDAYSYAIDPIPSYNDWIKYKVVVTKGNMKCFVNDNLAYDFNDSRIVEGELKTFEITTWGTNCSVKDIKHYDTVTCLHDDLQHVDAVKKTCSSTGNIEYWYCDECGQYFSDESALNRISSLDTIILASHNYGQWIEELSPTCIEDGYVGHYHCSDCNKDFDFEYKEIEDIVLKGGHKFDKQVVDEKYLVSTATCIAKAVYYYSCECGEVGTETFEYGDFGSHNYGEWIEEVRSSVANEGYVGHYHCDVCGKNFDENYSVLENIVIPKLDHDYGQWIEELSPSCTEDGYVGHYHCSDCNKDFDFEYKEIEDIVIKASHDYTWVEEVSATAVEEGTKAHYKCNNCDCVFNELKNEVTKESLITNKLADVLLTEFADFAYANKIEDSMIYVGNVNGGMARCTATAIAPSLRFDVLFQGGMEASGNAQIIFTINGSTYRVKLYPARTQNCIELSKQVADSSETLISSCNVAIALQANRYYSFQMQVTNSELKLYLDNSLLGSLAITEDELLVTSLTFWSWGVTPCFKNLYTNPSEVNNDDEEYSLAEYENIDEGLNDFQIETDTDTGVTTYKNDTEGTMIMSENIIRANEMQFEAYFPSDARGDSHNDISLITLDENGYTQEYVVWFMSTYGCLQVTKKIGENNIQIIRYEGFSFANYVDKYVRINIRFVDKELLIFMDDVIVAGAPMPGKLMINDSKIYVYYSYATYRNIKFNKSNLNYSANEIVDSPLYQIESSTTVAYEGESEVYTFSCKNDGNYSGINVMENTTYNTFETKIRINDSNSDRNAGIFIIANGVSIFLDVRPDARLFRLRINDAFVAYDKGCNGLAFDQWFSLKMTIKNGEVLCYFNDELIYDISNESITLEGTRTMRLSTWETNASFKDIVVSNAE